VWDLHYAAPEALNHEYPISAVPHDTPRFPLGPRALLGQYTVRLTVDGKSYTAPLTVKMDPRVKTPPAALEQQFQLETRLAGMMTQLTEAILQARSAAGQLHKLAGQAGAPAKASITAFETKLNDVLGKSGGFFAAPSPQITLSRMNADVSTLYGDVDRADAAPNLAQLNAMAETERNFTPLMQRWNALKSTDLPALNRELRSANLPQINLQAPPPSEEGGED
jgi:hypothetical protein